MKSKILMGVALASVSLCVGAAPGAKGKPEKAATVQPPTYYAANGALVGPLAFGGGYVVMRLDGLVFYLDVHSVYSTPDTAKWNTGESVYFDQTHCTGNAYIAGGSVPGFSGVGRAVYGPSGEITLYVGRLDSPVNFIAYSYLRDGICYPVAGQPVNNSYLAIATYDLVTRYPLPLRIR
jgi:hypothetical protein